MDSEKARRKLEERIQSEQHQPDDIHSVGGWQEESHELSLFQHRDTTIQLDAYMACALTGLNDTERDLVFQLSDTIAEICRTYSIELYEPRKKTDPVYAKDMPDIDVFEIDRKRVLTSDLLIHLAHFPSTGSGEEIEFASEALIPLIIISHEKTRVSRMITGVPGFKMHIRYKEPEELRSEFNSALTRIRPILVARKLAFSAYDANIIGTRIRELREGAKLTKAEVSKCIPGLTEFALKNMEENTDKIALPFLSTLRQIAAVLHVTLAELVEPDIDTLVMSYLQEYLKQQDEAGKFAARYDKKLSIKDRNKLIRRILLRVIDSLETEE